MDQRGNILLGIVILALPFFTEASATDGTIDATDKYARELSSATDRINFGTTDGNVHVTDSAVTGYAWSENYGWINLSPSQSGVTNNAEGTLSGYAWGQGTGWINFRPTNGGVSINSSGYFSGYAWSQNLGWIVFNCATDSSCATLDHKVRTDWRPASVRNAGGSTPPPDSGPGPGVVIIGTNPPPTPPPAPPPGGETGTPPSTPPSTPPGGSGAGEPVVPPPQNLEPPFVPKEVITPGSPGSLGNFAQVNPFSFAQSVLSNIVPDFSAITRNITKSAQQVFKDAETIVKSPEAQAPIQAISVVGTGGGLYQFISSFLFQPLSFIDIQLLILRAWAALLSLLGVRRKARPWGVVYDSITKYPLDPAYVTLRTTTGAEVSSAITDLDGRFGFLVPPGEYRLEVGKSNYTFPSNKLSGKTRDELYSDLYFGEAVEVAVNNPVIYKNIPMDQKNFDWNQYAKKKLGRPSFFKANDLLLARISNFFFGLGLLVTSFVTLVSPTALNIAFGSFYVALLLIRIFGPRRRASGTIRRHSNKAPLSYAIIKAYQVGASQELVKRVTDEYGRFYLLVPPGQYVIAAEEKLPDETYREIYRSPVLESKSGIIANTFWV